MRNVNLTVASISGKPSKNAGKVCERAGKWCFHQFVQTRWQRHDLQAWGINTAVVEYLDKHGIEDIYLFSAADDRTFYVHLGHLKAYGTPSDRHDWGENLNLPVEEWSVLPGRLKTPWVNEKCAVMLQPKPLIAKGEVPVKEPEDAIQQAQLFA